MPRSALRLSLTTLCLVACVVEPDGLDVDDRIEVSLGPPDPADPVDPPLCGGIGSIPCPGVDQICIDDPDDRCVPTPGYGDCPGICIDFIFCGGLGGFACPEDLECIDDPTDDCNPGKGHADCSGICVP